MPDIPLNPLALLIATVAGFFLSFVWYTPLFGKAWAEEMGFDPNEVKPAPALIKSLLLTVVSVFLISLVLANNIAAWTPSTWGVTGANLHKVAQALQAAFFTWMGFFLPNQVKKAACKAWAYLGRFAPVTPQVLGVQAAMLLANTKVMRKTLTSVSSKDLINFGVGGTSLGSNPISWAQALPNSGVNQT